MSALKQSILAATVIGGAVMLSGATPASAAVFAPTMAPTTNGVQAITHDPLARPGAYYGYRQPRYSYPYRYSRTYRQPAPAIGFGLSVPGFSFGLGVPGYNSYGYGSPYGYGSRYYGYGYRGY